MAKTKIHRNQILSDMIRKERKAQKITQEDLADKIGVTAQTIRKYESGNFGVPKSSITAIASALGCCEEYLLGKTDQRTKEEYDRWIREVKNTVDAYNRYCANIQEMYRISADFARTFLNYRIKITQAHGVTVSSVPDGEIFRFSSREEFEDFMIPFYDDARRLFEYHLYHREYTSKRGAENPDRNPHGYEIAD